MIINNKKTKMILFNPGLSRDFHPKFCIKVKHIDLVEETKLLGVSLEVKGSRLCDVYCRAVKYEKRLSPILLN